MYTIFINAGATQVKLVVGGGFQEKGLQFPGSEYMLSTAISYEDEQFPGS